MASTDWRLTRDQVITTALRKLGVIESGATPTANQINDGSEALNALVKGWQNIGVRLWTVEWNTQALTSGVSTYGLDPILDVQKAFVRRGDDDYPVAIVTLLTYFDQPDKADTGLAQIAAFNPVVASPELYVHPVPDNSTDVLHFLQVRRLYDMDAQGEYPDFPSRWIQPLIWNLASELAPEYGLPADLRQDLMGRGAAYLELAIRGERSIGPTDDFVRSAY
jgi:hypothetical protein